MQKLWQKHGLSAVGVLLGSLAGYLYYIEIGCHSGSCSITGSPLKSTLYGGLMGGLFLNLFQKKPKKENA